MNWITLTRGFLGRCPVFVTLLAICMVGCGEVGPSAAEDSPGTPNKWALLVGINEYKNPGELSTLDGCKNDVDDMKKLLTLDYDFPPANITPLIGSHATRDNILNGLDDLIGKANAGDIVVFLFSGHGSEVDDDDGDEQNGKDETIVPWDSRTEGVFDIRDDTLEDKFTRLLAKTENVTLIFDSCHSGTIAKGGGKARSAKPDTRPQPRVVREIPRATGSAKGASLIDEPKFALISGCHEQQSSYEMTVDNGVTRGALTYYLTREIRASRKKGVTYLDVMDKVKQLVRKNNSRQDPQLQGAGMDKEVFGTQKIVTQSYVPVVVDNGKMMLGGGLVSGLTKGSVFDVFPPGTKVFDDPAERIAQITIETVNAYDSEAKVTAPGDGEIVTGARAVEREHAYPKAKLTLFFDGLATSEVLRSVHTRVTKSPRDRIHFKIAEDKGKQFLLLSQVEEDGKKYVEIYGAEGGISERFLLSDNDLVDKVVRQLKHWAKWHNVLTITNPSPGLSVAFRITAPAGAKGNAAMKDIGSPELTVIDDGNEDTKEIEFHVTNNSGRDIHFSILDIASDGSVTPIFPNQGVSEALPHGETAKNEGKPIQTDVYVPRGERVTDFYKLIATDEPVDFSMIMMPAVDRGPFPEPPPGTVEALFVDAVLDTKQGRPVGRVKTDKWATEGFVVEVVKKQGGG